MKLFKTLLFVAAAGCFSFLLLTCNRQKAPKTVEVPFTAEALGEYKYVGPDTLEVPKCSDSLSAWRAVVEGTGTGTPMGSFTVHFDFCGDTVGHYGDGYAYMVAENGDTLFLDVGGQVFEGKLETHPEYVISYWQDTFYIVGGTGKYEGATGTVMSDDYNSSEDPYSHHHWNGTLLLVEKNK
jgi:hypothetical protein